MFITCQRLKNCRYNINAIRLNFFSLKKKHKRFHLRSIGRYEKKKKKRFSLLRLKGGLLTQLERL